MDQLSILHVKEESRTHKETAFMDAYIQSLKQIAYSMQLNPDDVTYETLESYSSFYFRSSLVAQVRMRRGKNWLGIPKRLADALPREAESKLSQNVLRFYFEGEPDASVQEVIEKALRLAIDQVPKEFDCCSRYLECSDAKSCTNPNHGIAILCGYRKILNSGKIFYGENRNV